MHVYTISGVFDVPLAAKYIRGQGHILGSSAGTENHTCDPRQEV